MEKKQKPEELCCEVCGLTRAESQYVRYIKEFEKVLCNKHFLHLKRFGRIIDRTTKDRNQFVLYEDYAEICLYNKDGVEISRTKIDLDDVERCRPLKWRILLGKFRTPYVGSYKDGKFFSLHVFLMGKKEGCVIDHINRDGLDNRKCNLRFVNASENSQNNWGKHVSRDKRNGKFIVEITKYGIRYRKAGFKTQEEAVAYRDKLMNDLDKKREELRQDFDCLGERLPHTVFCNSGWRAEISENGQTKMLGTFRTQEEAHAFAVEYLRKRDGKSDEKTQY